MPVAGAFTPGTSSGSAGTGGHGGAGLPATEVTALDAFLVRRGDYLGPTLVRRRAILEFELPQGTNLYLGFFTSMPDRRGIGGTECGVGGYARQVINRWTTQTIGASARRTNARAVTWDVFTSAVTLVGWGLWDAVTDGNLRDFDFLRGEDEVETTFPIAANGQPGIAAGRVGLAL